MQKIRPTSKFIRFFWIVALAGCSQIPNPTSTLTPTPTPSLPTQTPSTAATPTTVSTEQISPVEGMWDGLLLRSPFPYSTPLPPAERSAIDGIYAKFDPKGGTPVPCRRCPDYAPEAGWWRLSFDRGAYHLIHTVTGWKSLGSFHVSGDRLYLYNDPNCTHTQGIYSWKLEEGRLQLETEDDECAIRLRAENLSRYVWQSCQPPNQEAAVSDHWPKPEGCR